MLAGIALALVLAAGGPPAAAAERSVCRVLDPDLQGVYSGGCVNGLADGVGEASGIARYQGEFKEGRKHGKGVKTWPTGDRYEGQFADDRRNGSGTYTWGSGTPWAGEKYSGEYRDDRREGAGIYEWPDGERYSGMWEDDAPAGAPPRRMRARLQEERERLAAVAKPGQMVCRQVRVGSVVQDWVRGTVTELHGRQVTVRIDDPGQFEHRIQGVEAKKGAAIRDWGAMWVPCRP